jgi:3-deoxy-D-manno-octulosonic-acid transferase
MRFLYNIIFTTCFALASPYYFLRMLRRGNWRAGFAQRFGDYDKDIQQSLTNRHVLWVHAVSVGEMNVCVALVNALHQRMPNAKILVSTTTTTGMAELQKRLPGQFGKVYYPIDRHKFVSMAFRALHPTAIILIEGEIWPNFIWRARASRLPLFLVNARLSDRSYPRYKRFAWPFRQLFGAFTGVGAQTEEYGAKLRDIGCRPEAVQVLGNLKFDTANLRAPQEPNVGRLLAQLGVPADVPILLGGSTHKGEERMLAELYLRLRSRFPSLFLVLVPRHFERAREIRRELESLNLKLFSRSEITPNTRLEPGSLQCLLVDSTGELMNFYQCATVVFVGKSMLARGGQNPIEPAALGKPTVFGPHMGNFPDVARLFVSREAAVQVRDPRELERTVSELLSDPARCQRLGANARAVVLENQGAVARTVEMIVEPLAKRGVFIAPHS